MNLIGCAFFLGCRSTVANLPPKTIELAEAQKRYGWFKEEEKIKKNILFAFIFITIAVEHLIRIKSR